MRKGRGGLIRGVYVDEIAIGVDTNSRAPYGGESLIGPSPHPVVGRRFGGNSSVNHEKEILSRHQDVGGYHVSVRPRDHVIGSVVVPNKCGQPVAKGEIDVIVSIETRQGIVFVKARIESSEQP